MRADELELDLHVVRQVLLEAVQVDGEHGVGRAVRARAVHEPPLCLDAAARAPAPPEGADGEEAERRAREQQHRQQRRLHHYADRERRRYHISDET